MSWISNPEMWIALVTLLALEIVLGIDNIVFISILTGKLPAERQARARTVGLALAMLTRVGLLLSLSWIIRLTEPIFSVLEHDISGRDMILILGGLFLMAKSTHEIHEKLEGEEGHGQARGRVSFGWVIVQILLLDIIFSLDSVITAVGMVSELSVMIIAVVLAVIFMMFFAGSISAFVERHPTIKMLALSFLILIGVTLVLEGLHQHVPKGYIYFAMAYSVGVEMLNLRLRKKESGHVKLRGQYMVDDKPAA
jgi:predicted tellurium resistance membrane protein TerC